MRQQVKRGLFCIMEIRVKSAFATATIFLILLTITVSLAALLSREKLQLSYLPSIIGHRYQMEFKKDVELRVLNSSENNETNTLDGKFTVLELPTQGLFNLSQIVNGQGVDGYYFDKNLLRPTAELINDCGKGLASIEDIKSILFQFITKTKSIPMIALEPYSSLTNETLLNLSPCLRISPKISKTNLSLSPARVLSLIFEVDISKANTVSEKIRKNEIKNFDKLISFFKQNNYSYNDKLKWHDFTFGIFQTSRSVALEKNGDIFFMADLFVYENEQEIVSWSDLQWLPGG